MKSGDTQSPGQGDTKRRMKFKGLWRPEDIVASLGISRDTLERWKKQKMPFIKIGGIVFIPEVEFLEWLRGYMVNGSEKGGNRQDAL